MARDSPGIHIGVSPNHTLDTLASESELNCSDDRHGYRPDMCREMESVMVSDSMFASETEATKSCEQTRVQQLTRDSSGCGCE